LSLNSSGEAGSKENQRQQAIALDDSGAQTASFRAERCTVRASCARLPLQKAFGAHHEIEADLSVKQLSPRP